MKRKYLTILATCLLSLSLTMLLSACGDEEEEPANSNPFSAVEYGEDAGVSIEEEDKNDVNSGMPDPDSFLPPDYSYLSVDNSDISTDYVRILPGTTKEMLSPDYWIDLYYAGGGSGMPIMDLAEIDDFSLENESLIGVDGFDPFYQISIGDTMDGKLVRALVDCVEAPKNPSNVYVNGKATDASYWKKMHDLLNLSAIGDTVSVRFGYSVDRQSLRAYPSNDFAADGAKDEFFDQAVMSEYMPYLPLVIVHESADQEWCYVITYGFAGWIEKKYVAFCHDKQEWLSLRYPSEFLMVTGREIRLPDVQGDERISGLLLPMGTMLPLEKAENAPASIHGRTTYNNYVVKLKVRGTDGYLEEVYGLIPVTEDVYVGYVPYTTENVLKQEFKLLGDRYGWAGLGHSDDCSGTLRMVYNCFGLSLPRTGGAQVALKGVVTYDLSGMTDAEKIETISHMLPGSFVFFPGHIMMYIGTVDGEPYVISSVSSFATADMADGDIMRANTVTINNLVKTKRKSGASWLSSMTKAVELRRP